VRFEEAEQEDSEGLRLLEPIQLDRVEKGSFFGCFEVPLGLLEQRHPLGQPAHPIHDVAHVGARGVRLGRGNSYDPFRKVAKELPCTGRVIAEPGRFICGPAGTVLTSLMGRAQRDGRWWYYLDDGLYGSFSGQLYDHARYPVEPLRVRAGPREHCVLAGPTCDSIDVIAEDIELPPLQYGDILVGRQMGAYTTASATDFNFFPRARTVVVNR